MFNNLIKYPTFPLSDSDRVQKYKQKPSRATLCVSFLKIKEIGLVLEFVSLFFVSLHPY